MAAQAERLLHHLECWFGQTDTTSDDDASLLQRFVSRKDEAAFAALLTRHGPMVHGVCRRVLRDDHEAEDALQATFLLLARKAGSLRRPETLAAWLYGAARRLALMALRSNHRRQRRETESADMQSAGSGNPLDELSARELLLILDEEIARLPERYRIPLILCVLEGRSQAEAARQLGWTTDSVRGRLERGRARLRTSLVRRGLRLGANLFVMESMATVTVSGALRKATVRMASSFASGSSQGIASPILALVESGARSITMQTAKWGSIIMLGLALVAGACVLAYPPECEKPIEEQQATAARFPEGKNETTKPANDKQAPTDLYGDPLPSGAIARLGTVRFRHGGELAGVFVSPDGRTLISVGHRAVSFWDTRTGRRQRQLVLSHPYGRVGGIDLSPDGKLLATPFFGEKMRFWDLANGAEVHPFGNDAPDVRRAVFSPNGEFLATHDAFNQKTISIWDFRKGKKIRTIEGGELISSPIRSLAFSPRGNLLVFPRATGVCVWDVATDKELYQLDLGTKTTMGCLAFSADGKLLAAAANAYPYQQNKDHSIHLWDMATGKEVGALKGHEDSITALASSSKSGLLASASRDGTIGFWDVATRQKIGRSSGPARHFNALAFSSDGNMLASGENLGALRLWDARKQEEMAIPSAGNNSAEWVRFAPDGQSLISTVIEQIGLWEPLTGRPRRLFHNKDLYGYNPAISPDGKLLAAISYPNMGREAMLWDLDTGRLVRKWGGDGQPRLSSLTFSPDGRRVAGTASDQGVIHIWDVSSGKELQQLKGHSRVYSVAFAPDGATLASSSISTVDRGDLTVRLWKLASGEEIWRKATRGWSAFEMKFSPDGRILALVGGMFGQRKVAGEVRLWEAATGKELKRFDGHREHVRCVDFTADGRMLATGSVDNTIRLWEVASGRERQCLEGHQYLILAVSFSPNGRLLASSSADETALVWDLTGRFRDGRFQMQSLSAAELDRCWNDLADADAARAYRGIVALWGSPKEAVAFLKDRLSPMTAVVSKRVAPLLAALDSDHFDERDKAMAELEKLGLAVEPALSAALDVKPSLETRRRIEAVQDKLAIGPRLRLSRAFETLERIATPEARQFFETISKGSAELWPTQEAKASLARLSARPPLRP